MNEGTKVMVMMSNGKEKEGKILIEREDQSSNYTVYVDGSVYFNVNEKFIKVVG